MSVVELEDLLCLRSDLSPAAAEAMIAGAVARAAMVAPCITKEDFEFPEAAKGIILDALLRRVDAGSGSVTTPTAGPFSLSTDTRSSVNLFTGQERNDLAALCKAGRTKARTLWTFPAASADPLDGAVINYPEEP